MAYERIYSRKKSFIRTFAHSFPALIDPSILRSG
jgi:hypothetical protein